MANLEQIVLTIALSLIVTGAVVVVVAFLLADIQRRPPGGH